MRIRIKNLVPLVVFQIVLIQLFAESDFTGTWKMNLEESDFGYLESSGTLFGPNKATQTVRQEGSIIRVEWVQQGSTGEIRAELTYQTDGSECRNKLEGYALRSKVDWNGDDLLVESSLEMDPFFPDILDR